MYMTIGKTILWIGVCGGEFGPTLSNTHPLEKVYDRSVNFSMNRSKHGPGEYLQCASLDRGTVCRLCKRILSRTEDLAGKSVIQGAPRFRLVWCRVAAHAACLRQLHLQCRLCDGQECSASRVHLRKIIWPTRHGMPW